MNAKEKLTKTVRKARCLGLTNKIEAIKVIRTAYPDAGLKGAKDFWDLVDSEWGIYAATEIAIMWCSEHWNHRPCAECARDARPETAVAIASVGAAKAFEAALVADEPAAAPRAKCHCKPGAMKNDCADAWHRAAWWVAQTGNYTKLMAWIDAGMPDDGSIPFAKREGEWIGVEVK